jgi:hypothetical protein
VVGGAGVVVGRTVTAGGSSRTVVVVAVSAGCVVVVVVAVSAGCVVVVVVGATVVVVVVVGGGATVVDAADSGALGAWADAMAGTEVAAMAPSSTIPTRRRSTEEPDAFGP